VKTKTDRGKCRNNRKSCEACEVTPIEDIYSIHYTACRKPWNCISKGTKDPLNKEHKKNSVPEDIVHLDHCMELLNIWHSVRTDLENKLFAKLGDEVIRQGQSGSYNYEAFQGHCEDDQNKGYLPLAGGNAEVIKKLPEVMYS